MSEEQTKGAGFEDLCEALRGRLRESGYCDEAAHAIMASARCCIDWTTSPPPIYIPPGAAPALQALKTTWTRRCADALEIIVRLYAEIYRNDHGFGPPPSAKKAQPDWLRLIDGGKSAGERGH
jgi:hypothetical protein